MKHSHIIKRHIRNRSTNQIAGNSLFQSEIKNIYAEVGSFWSCDHSLRRVLETGVMNVFHPRNAIFYSVKLLVNHELRTSSFVLKVIDMTFCGVFFVFL